MRKFFTAYDSEQILKEATQLQAATPIDPTELQGRVRVARFTKTQDFAQNDTLNGPLLPKGARVLMFQHIHNLGVSSLTLKYSANDGSSRVFAAAVAATNDTAGQLVASEYTTTLAAAARLVLTFENANPPADGAIDGYVFYVLD